jgi:hypothetical protein
MIEIPRKLLRQFRSVLRTFVGRGRSVAWPVIVCKAGRHGLTLEARHDDMAVRYYAERPRPEDNIAFNSTVLAELEANSGAPVLLEQRGSGRAVASWPDKGETRTLEFETFAPEQAPAFPALPEEFKPMPTHFLRALHEAGETAARDRGRYAVSHLLLDGCSGEIAATDLKHMLVQDGFPFPWSDAVLVPRMPLFGRRDFPPTCELGRTDNHVGLRLGGWLLLLAIDKEGRFPDITTVIPSSKSVVARIRLHPDDVAQLLSLLPEVQSGDDESVPVTLELGKSAMLLTRCRDGSIASVPLNHSQVTGKPVRIVLCRHHLLRAVRLGFTELQVCGPERPVLCRDKQRLYLFMPLTDGPAAMPNGKTACTTPREESPVDPSPPTPERTSTMPRPASNDRSHENQDVAPARERPAGIDELIAETEELRATLGDAYSRVGRLLSALKQHRRQSRALRDVVASLRQIQLEN